MSLIISTYSKHDLFCWAWLVSTLTSPATLLWPIHEHSHKYLSQLSSKCEQKPIGKMTRIYTWTKMAALNFGGLRETRTQALHAKSLHLSEWHICISCPISIVVSTPRVSTTKNGHSCKNGSRLKTVTLVKMDHTWKNGSHLDKRVTLVKISHTWKKRVT